MTLFSVFLKCSRSADKNVRSSSFSHGNKVQRKGIRTSVRNRPHHGYHLVDPSPWPALTRLCMLWLTVSLVLFFHQYVGAGTSLIGALLCLTYMASLWWRDVVREGVLGFHTRKVKNGLHLGMLLFIWSEAMFFIGLLWRFMNAALMPTIQLGMSWPPLGIVPLHWTGLPKTNTLILLASYFTANGAKHALENHKKNVCGLYLMLTIGLGRLFMYCQYLEYTSASFTFSDTVYGSRFYLTTGFHGFHVFVGRIYLAVCFFLLNETNAKNAVAFNLAVLYWHFVDLVWIALLVLLYVWGSAVPAHEIEACSDGICALSVILSDRKAELFLSQKFSRKYIFLYLLIFQCIFCHAKIFLFFSVCFHFVEAKQAVRNMFSFSKKYKK